MEELSSPSLYFSNSMEKNSTASQQFKEKFFLTWFKRLVPKTRRQQLL
jgi:hypothetical protein